MCLTSCECRVRRSVEGCNSLLRFQTLSRGRSLLSLRELCRQKINVFSLRELWCQKINVLLYIYEQPIKQIVFVCSCARVLNWDPLFFFR